MDIVNVIIDMFRASSNPSQVEIESMMVDLLSAESTFFTEANMVFYLFRVKVVKDLADVYECLAFLEAIISSLSEDTKAKKQGMLIIWLDHMYDHLLDFVMKMNSR